MLVQQQSLCCLWSVAVIVTSVWSSGCKPCEDDGDCAMSPSPHLPISPVPSRLLLHWADGCRMYVPNYGTFLVQR